MSATKTVKKSTTLSVLKKIQKDTSAMRTAIDLLVSSQSLMKAIDEHKGTTITFPSKTAKEIVDECDNKVADGKLLYNTDWYENEDFYTKEKCRPRTVVIPTSIEHAGKTWDECNKEGEMFNFAEIVYLLRESESFRKLLSSDNAVRYTWTSSRDSGGCLVSVGYFVSDGAYVSGWVPGSSASGLGVCFDRS